MDDVPKIEPIKLQEWETKQPKYSMVPQIPFRSIILGPSGSGKTILLQNLILNIYKNCFSIIFFFRHLLMLIQLGYQLKIYTR